jgi:hypothetical protein
MRIDTAFGLTDGIKPECGCWGQGAEESPLGWLAFMCWMSDYINHTKHIDPYIYTTGYNTTTQMHKIIYADDGTYVSRSKQGLQNMANAISNFCTATGIIVKPEKSYVYIKRMNQRLKRLRRGNQRKQNKIYIRTHQGGNGKLGPSTKTNLTTISADDAWRHLGNVQTAKGKTIPKKHNNV